MPLLRGERGLASLCSLLKLAKHVFHLYCIFIYLGKRIAPSPASLMENFCIASYCITIDAPLCHLCYSPYVHPYKMCTSQLP